MRIETNLNNQFDPLVAYAEEINHLNGGSGSAIVVIHRGRIVTERYHGFHSHEQGARSIQADSLFNVTSTRKSYIGFAVGCALFEGNIKRIDDLVTDYLPELDHELLQDTTIRHLLTHSHGLNEDGEGNIYREFPVGTDWAYRGINIVLLTSIVRRATGKTVAQIVAENVFAPLGLKETGWLTESNEQMVPVILDQKFSTEQVLGTNNDGDGGQTNMYVSARELAYWGYLHLKQGNIEGKQVVPQQIFQSTTSLQSPPMTNKDLPQNGFLWFVKDLPAQKSEIGDKVPAASFQIIGVTGPLMLVIPEHELVVVRMYNKRFNYGGANYLHYLREFGNKVVECL